MPDNNERPPATPSKIGRTTKAGEKRANVKKGGEKKPGEKKTSGNKRKRTADDELSPNTPKPQPQPRSCRAANNMPPTKDTELVEPGDDDLADPDNTASGKVKKSTGGAGRGGRGGGSRGNGGIRGSRGKGRS
ncbi:uncharacterized protein BDR25DRAFT_27562 [Lindgomyces ingoldianus]|uniref:Uncharacterized protein n=1 Tax=Lindgomyces ingoldianus TaxID=673940 RepID=A0ACB6Q6N0_9PLEO|nr:uncharacterized protein BDR25DRAFT_27562 [Lindgomyces ingoldianus]KAF2462483.1 hypothetical protein BDR25DRAFT_27562 [Lindgomyces ingoldianus]